MPQSHIQTSSIPTNCASIYYSASTCFSCNLYPLQKDATFKDIHSIACSLSIVDGKMCRIKVTLFLNNKVQQY